MRGEPRKPQGGKKNLRQGRKTLQCTLTSGLPLWAPVALSYGRPLGDLGEHPSGRPSFRSEEAGSWAVHPEALWLLPGVVNTPACPREDRGAHSSSCRNPSGYHYLQSEAFRELQNGELEGTWVEH